MAFAVTHAYVDEPASACPNQATPRLYDEAMAAMQDAVDAITANDIDARCRAVQKATEIVAMLYVNLDVRRQGELADDLGKIYGHVMGLLLRVNLYNDAQIATRVIDLLESLRESRQELYALVAACQWTNAPVEPAGMRRIEVA